MKKLIHISLLCFALTFFTRMCFAQKVELSAGASGNQYNYSGNLSRSQIDYYSNAAALFYSYPAYSKTLTGGYGADLKLQYIHKAGFIVGVGLGYDVVRSKINSTSTYIADLSATPPPGGYKPDATGYNLTTLKQLSVNPYVGYRLTAKMLSIDLQLGAEVPFVVENKVRTVLFYTYPIDDTFYYPNKNALNNRQDYRLKAGIAINYRRFGINFSYAHGVSNFYKGVTLPGSSSKNSLYSQLIKAGVSYRIF